MFWPKTEGDVEVYRFSAAVPKLIPSHPLSPLPQTLHLIVSSFQTHGHKQGDRYIRIATAQMSNNTGTRAHPGQQLKMHPGSNHLFILFIFPDSASTEIHTIRRAIDPNFATIIRHRLIAIHICDLQFRLSPVLPSTIYPAELDNDIIAAPKTPNIRKMQ